MIYVKWLLKNMDRNYQKMLLIGLIISMVTSIMQLIDPWLTSKLYDDVIMAQNPDPLLPILGTMLAVQLFRIVTRHIMVILLEESSQNLLVKMRKELFKKLQFQDFHFFGRYRTGDLMTRLQGDLDYFRHVVAYTSYMLVDSFTLLIAAYVLFFCYSWKLSLVLLIVMPLTIYAMQNYRKKVHHRFRELRERMANMNTAAQENIAGNRVVKAFVREDYEIERFKERNWDFRSIHLEINKTWLSVYPILESAVVLISLLIVFFGGYFIMQGEITEGQLAMFTTLSFALITPLRNIGPHMDDLQRCVSSAQKVMEVYYGEPSVKDSEETVPHDGMRGDIRFEHVDFAFDSTPVLKDVSFHIPAGGTLAIMGPTGSGKTTLINLIARLYDVTGGRVLIDGDDVREWKLQELRSHIGVATQEVFLFSDTIENNIAFSDLSMEEEEAHDFATRAAVAEFAKKMPEGFETVVGERGVGLSGGQRQRIALARAMAAKPSILILDDTTSALDMETEKYIQKQLKELPYLCTKIIIGQRISSVKDADLILVLNDGGIAEMGTHAELVKNGGYYYETYALQNDISLTGGEEV